MEAGRGQRCRHDTLAAILASALVLAGCSGVSSKISPLGDDLIKQTTPIIVGESDRASVRELLGQPWLTSDRWRFDLFRSTDRNAATFVFAFIPMARVSQQVRGYVLVSYAEDGKVVAFDTDFGQSGNVLGPASPKAAIVGAGGLAYWESDDGDTRYVAVDPTRAADLLDRAVAAGRCRLLIATVSDSCGLRAAIDGGQPVTLPSDAGKFPPSLLPVYLVPGGHELRFTPDLCTAVSYEAVGTLSCAAGQSAYVAVTLTRKPLDRWQWNQKMSAEVTVELENPELAHGRGLIIYANDQWLVAEDATP